MAEPEMKAAAASSTTVSSSSTTTTAAASSVPSSEPTPSSSSANTQPSSANTTAGSESDVADAEFEPTAEMMMDEFDDERTLDEAEAEAAIDGDDQEEEISNLQKEQDMPIEELLAMYGGARAVAAVEAEAGAEESDGVVVIESREESSSTVPEEVIVEDDDDEDMDQDGDCEVQEVIDISSNKNYAMVLPKRDTLNRSHQQQLLCNPTESSNIITPRTFERRGRRRESDLIQLYPEMESNGDHHNQQRALRSTSGQQSDNEDDDGGEGEGESGDEMEEEEYRKTIMIGSAYQAQVPEGLQAYGATPPYENQDKLLWEPHLLSFEEVEKFLYTVSQPSSGAIGVQALPLGLHVRDDEQALHLLLQCGGNVEEARRRHNMNRAPIASTMTLWSEEECRNFENGLKNYGKDFHTIHQNKVRTRSVGELVQFYYLWKKTERHDMFAAKTRLEKKKFIVHPGTTDYMDRFLNEGDGGNNNHAVNHSSSNHQQQPDCEIIPNDNNHQEEDMPEEINYNSAVHTSSFSCNSAMIPSTSSNSNNNNTPSSSTSRSSSLNGESNGSSASNGTKRKRDYVIPELPPSDVGINNQKKWKENQKPSVEMHALLYGRLPAGYKASKLIRGKSNSLVGTSSSSTANVNITSHLHPDFGGALGNKVSSQKFNSTSKETVKALPNTTQASAGVSKSNDSSKVKASAVAISKPLIFSKPASSNNNLTTFGHSINKPITKIDVIAQTLSREKANQMSSENDKSSSSSTAKNL